MAEHADVVVIGGGLAGLAAALELKAAGRDVVVLEAGASLGGKAQSRKAAGGLFPTGPSSFSGKAVELWRLLDLLGLSNEAVKLDPRTQARFLVRGGRLQGIRPNPVSLFTTGAFTWAERWAIVKELFARDASKAPAGDESMKDFLTRRFGESLTTHVFAGLFNGIYAGDLARLSARTCLTSLVESERATGSALRGLFKKKGPPSPAARRGFFTLAGGFGRIGEAAGQQLAARLETSVTALDFRGGGVAAAAKQGGRELVLDARQVVLATEADVAARILGGALPEASKLLARFPYSPVSLVQWVERTPGESKLPLGFGYLSPPVEQTFALGTLFTGDLVGATPRAFTTFVGGALTPERAALGDAELVAGVMEDLKRLTGGAFGELAQIIRWPGAVFQAPVGHAELLAALETSVGDRPVALAGSYLGAAAMRDAAAAGQKAATRLLSQSVPQPVRAVA